MTVEELIAALERMPPGAQVWADTGAGPDANPVTGVDLDWLGDAVIRVLD